MELFRYLKKNYKYIFDDELVFKVVYSFGSLYGVILIEINFGFGVFLKVLFEVGVIYIIGFEFERRFYLVLWYFKE